MDAVTITVSAAACRNVAPSSALLWWGSAIDRNGHYRIGIQACGLAGLRALWSLPWNLNVQADL